MITQLGNVTVVVRDLNRALRFYRDKLGLRLAFHDRKHKWLCFDARGVSFSLTVPWNRKAAKLVGVPTGVSFYVDDLEHTFQQLKRKRVHFNFGPRQESWGGRLANFEDPDGNKFFLLQMPPDFGR